MVYNTLKRVYVHCTVLYQENTTRKICQIQKHILRKKQGENLGKGWVAENLWKWFRRKNSCYFFLLFSSTAFCTPAVFSTFLFQLNCLKKYISTGMYLCCCPYFLSTFFLKISSKTSYSLKDYLSRTQNCHRFFSVSFKRCSAAAILVGSETVF